MKFRIYTTLLFIVALSISQAQLDMPRVSPNASVSQTLGYTVITLTYCRPGVKDRTIWGDLVPYNKVWRTGANESTRIQFTTDVNVEGTRVPAGIYSLYTIPSKDEWTVIINKALVWGLDYYPDKDLFRFKVKPSKAPFTERLLFTMPELTDSSCTVNMNWENLQISFNIEVNLANQVLAKIKDAISQAKPDDFQVYIVGAQFAADHNVFINEAFQWIDKALSISKNFNCYLVKARLYYIKGKYVDALRTIELCREAGRKDSDYNSQIGEVDLLEKRIKEKM